MCLGTLFQSYRVMYHCWSIWPSYLSNLSVGLLQSSVHSAALEHHPENAAQILVQNRAVSLLTGVCHSMPVHGYLHWLLICPIQGPELDCYNPDGLGVKVSKTVVSMMLFREAVLDCGSHHS